VRPPRLSSVRVHLIVFLGLSSLLSACGGAATHAPATTSTKVTTTVQSAPPTTSTGPGALQAEANSASAGDIPDNQVFLVFRNRAAGYSLKYPEGWAQRGTGTQVTFRDKNNIVRVVISNGPPPSLATARSDLHAMRGARVEGAPQRFRLAGAAAVKARYSTVSAPNAVTGKRVTLVVDRYYLWKKGRRAVVELGTPVGVDNVDAYRLMIESFR
jgi:hypothetical protein